MKLTKFENPGNEFKEIYGGKSPENPSDGQSQDKTKPFIRPPSMITGILAGFLLQQIVKILLMLR